MGEDDLKANVFVRVPDLPSTHDPTPDKETVTSGPDPHPTLHPQPPREPYRKFSETAAWLSVISLLGAIICYITSILAARILGTDAFGEYMVAIAALMTLAGLSELATGKHALRIIPRLAVNQEWSLMRGYIRFSFFLVVSTSFILGSFSASSEGIYDQQFGKHAVGIAMLFLPAVALVGAGVDFVMANQASISGMVVARLLVPGTTLVLILVGSITLGTFDESWAVACYGMGSVVGLATIAVLMRRSTPREVFRAPAEYRLATWTKSLIALVGLVFLMTLVFKIGILLLETIHGDRTEVSKFAAAMETGSLILLLSKTTDKFYQPKIALIIEMKNWEQAAQLRWRRHAFIGSVCVVFLVSMFVFGKQLLSVFGPDFVDAYSALMLISLGTCCWTVLSMAPAYLRFVGKTSWVMVVSGVSVLLLIGLTAWLAPRYGANGAAVAFLIAVWVMMVSLLILATRHFTAAKRRLKKKTESANA